MFAELKGPLGLLVVVLGGLVLAYAAFIMFGAPIPHAQEVKAPFVPEPPSEKVIEQLKKSRGFEVLISYTDNGFEPSQTTINRGESMRFTNNSSTNLWIASSGSAEYPEYPGVSDCGSSFFDTCGVLAPREFWEFTFEEAGTWMFVNNIDKEKSGTVLVNVQ